MIIKDINHNKYKCLKEGYVMDIKQFIDTQRISKGCELFNKAMKITSGLILDSGEIITEHNNVNSCLDFFIKYAKNNTLKNPITMTTECQSTGYYQIIGGILIFSIDVVVEATSVAKLIGGGRIEEKLNTEELQKAISDLHLIGDRYINSLNELKVQDEDTLIAIIETNALSFNNFCGLEYYKETHATRINELQNAITTSNEIIKTINNNTKQLKSIADRQKMLSLNASIEAARSGDAGVGFAVVAKSMQDLSSHSSVIYNDIEKSVAAITSELSRLQ